MKAYYVSIGLLLCSNVFMTFAWYGHLKNLAGKPLLILILISWGLFFLYSAQNLFLFDIGNGLVVIVWRVNVLLDESLSSAFPGARR